MDEVIYIDLREVVVDDPVHEVEAGEGHREHNPGVLVHVRGRHSQHAVDMAVPLCRQLIVQRHLVAEISNIRNQLKTDDIIDQLTV